MLICRIPYFATLLSSDFTDKSSDVSLKVEVCSSGIFKKILDFVWTGELQMSYMNMNTILTLLETARFLCIDLLVDGIGEYIKHQFNWKKIDFVSSLNALEFSTSHNFPKISNIIFGFIDRNIDKISSLSEFNNLSTDSMMMLLSTKEGRVSSEISLFKAFLKWLEGNEDISEVTKEEIANLFDLDNFSGSDWEIVKKSNLYSEKQLLHQILSRVQDLEEEIATLQPARYLLTIDRYESDAISVWKMDICSSTNCIEFNLKENSPCPNYNGGFKYDYIVETSTDGETWSRKDSKLVFSGNQVVTFQRMKMQFVRIELGSKNRLCSHPSCSETIHKLDVSNVQAALK